MSLRARSGPPEQTGAPAPPGAGAVGAAVAPDRAGAIAIAAVRVAVALLWLVNVGWKVPPDFSAGDGRGQYMFTTWAVKYEVFGPFAWVVREIVLPNYHLFAWGVFVIEACIGGFLLVGLFTRGWALVGVAQSVVIGLSVLNAPHEWPWSYYLMVAANLMVFATAAGRVWGIDGIVRPVWASRPGRLRRLALRLS